MADFSIGSICKKLYWSSKDLIISKLRYSMDSTRQDVLLFGSSRAAHHFIPDIMEQISGFSTYNNGIDAADLLFSEMQLKETLKRYKPKCIVLESSPSSLFITDARAGYKLLQPYYSRDTSISNMLTRNSALDKVKYISSIYPYNSNIASLLKGVIKKSVDLYKGYIPVNGSIDTNGINSFVNKSYINDKLPIDQLGYLNDFIQTCRKHEVTLIIVSSPVFRVNENHDVMVKKFQSFCEQFKEVHYLDYTKYQPVYGNPKFFKDNTHMNNNGATIFSQDIAGKTKELIATK